jgi:2-succinyl-5-enolpyruvyl-6-hydroxy-3-cyclohexene-1-carboxylate synthase
MSVNVTYRSDLTVAEVLETGVSGVATAAKKTVTHDKYNTGPTTLSAATTPAASKVAEFEAALTAGAASIDLSALVGTNGATVVGTGLKVQAFKFRAKSTNTGPITIAKGASDGYGLLGAAFSVALAPGAEMQSLTAGGSPAVGSSAKTLDLSGTGTDVLEVAIILG